MKKVLAILLVLMVTCSPLLACVACVPKPYVLPTIEEPPGGYVPHQRDNTGDLSREMVMALKQTYLDDSYPVFPKSRTINSVAIPEYCGTYNGCVVVMIEEVNPSPIPEYEIITIVVEGVEFKYPEIGPQLSVWKEGRFLFNKYEGIHGYSVVALQRAYDLGWLAQDDLKNIATIHKSVNSHL